MSSPTWKSHDLPRGMPIGITGMIRVLCRGTVLSVTILGCLGLLLLIRLIERPFYGARRPWTPHITVFVCKSAFWVLGIKYKGRGLPMEHPGAIVSNHSSWLDILALNAGGPLYFVAKSEVAGWPGIGWLARATGTLFVRRHAREARQQKVNLEQRLAVGHRLLIFPEGTSTDGLRVLPFKPTLFAAFFSQAIVDDLWVQPVTVVYHAPEGQEPRFYGWWGDMDLGPHLLQVLAANPQGQVEVVWHQPLKVSEFESRKTLSLAAETQVRTAHKLAPPI